VLSVSERRACAALGQHRSTQRKLPQGRDDEARLTADVIELARQYGRYGYRKIAELLRRSGWPVKFAHRIEMSTWSRASHSRQRIRRSRSLITACMAGAGGSVRHAAG
jgi:putative transposase